MDTKIKRIEDCNHAKMHKTKGCEGVDLETGKICGCYKTFCGDCLLRELRTKDGKLIKTITPKPPAVERRRRGEPDLTIHKR